MVLSAGLMLGLVLMPSGSPNPSHDGTAARAADLSRAGFPVRQTIIDFDDLKGWAEDDHAAALRAFARSCEHMRVRAPRTRASGVDGNALAALCALIDGAADDPRAFFEARFQPVRIEASGRLTGYFEPQVEASFERTDRFRYPLHARPPDLVELAGDPGALGIEDAVTWGRATGTGFEAFPDRAAIMAGALAGEGLELVWLDNPVDAFFIHIQGSARLAMTDGTVQRVNFAGKSGHAYTPIGRTLVEQGEMALQDVTMDSLRAWLFDAVPHERDAVFASNRSYIFFVLTEDTQRNAGPVAAANVPLTAGRSLAVDRHLHTFGTPVFIASPDPLPGSNEPLRRLVIAQDTGSAIVGPARGDLFIGSGAGAGSLAGEINQPVTFTLLVPTNSGG